VGRIAIFPLVTLVAAAGATDFGCKADAPPTTPAAEGGAAGATPQFLGRFDASDPAGPRFAWSASAISVRFTGPSIAIRLRDDGNNQLQVVVDGVPTSVVVTGPSREAYSLASGLAPGEHEVTSSAPRPLSAIQFLFDRSGGAMRPMPARVGGRRICLSATRSRRDMATRERSRRVRSAPTENEFLTWRVAPLRRRARDDRLVGRPSTGWRSLRRTLRRAGVTDFGAWCRTSSSSTGTGDFFKANCGGGVTTAYVSTSTHPSHYRGAHVACIDSMLSHVPASQMN
jgi:hypothetical protein